MVIILDPGHNEKSNVSPVNQNYIEGVAMWYLAGYLKYALEKAGAYVYTTRPNLTDFPNHKQRASLVQKHMAGLIISLHSNAAGTEKAWGTELYYPITNPEFKSFCDLVGERVADYFGHPFRGSKTRALYKGQSIDYYAMIRHPLEYGCKDATIIEIGFHTSPYDLNYLMQDQCLRDIAEIISASIVQYYNITRKQNPQTGGRA